MSNCNHHLPPGCCMQCISERKATDELDDRPLTINAQAFDRAFAPATFSNVIRANLPALSADLLIGGEVYAVSPIRCEICDEWDPRCEHLELVKEYVAGQNCVDDAQDQYETYRDALEVGIQ